MRSRSRATRRLALAGESAGGNLAVATAVAARDAGLRWHVLTVYPIAQPDTTTPSYVENANAKPLNRAMMGWFAKQVSRTAADLQDPRISLVKADLKGLPPVTIVNAQVDPLLDDGAMLEKALGEARCRGRAESVRRLDPRILRHGRRGERCQAGPGVGGRAAEGLASGSR